MVKSSKNKCAPTLLNFSYALRPRKKPTTNVETEKKRNDDIENCKKKKLQNAKKRKMRRLMIRMAKSIPTRQPVQSTPPMQSKMFINMDTQRTYVKMNSFTIANTLQKQSCKQRVSF